MEEYGKIIAPDTIRFRRSLRGPIEKVWAYLTDPDLRGKWLARGEMELFEGGKVNLHFLHKELSPEIAPIPEKFRDMESGHSFTGTVLKIAPPYLLSFTWADLSEVTFELQEQDGSVLLTLTHHKIPRDKNARISMSGGWQTHLDILIANCQGTVPPNFWKRYTEMEAFYTNLKRPVAETAMLIRKPVAETFEAFINPAITTRFWFTKSTGPLEKGRSVRWIWEMYNVSSLVEVKEIIPHSKIEIEWGADGQDRTRVEWTFQPMDDHSTFVSIVTDGFNEEDKDILEKVAGTVGGFCWVLAGLKACLEFNIQLNLIADRFPKGKN